MLIKRYRTRIIPAHTAAVRHFYAGKAIAFAAAFSLRLTPAEVAVRGTLLERFYGFI